MKLFVDLCHLKGFSRNHVTFSQILTVCQTNQEKWSAVKPCINPQSNINIVLWLKWKKGLMEVSLFKVACWLLDSGSKERTLHSMVTTFLPNELPLLEGVGTGQGVQSLGLSASSDHSGRYRAAIESVLIFNVMNQLHDELQKQNLTGKESSSTWGQRQAVRVAILP